MSRNEGTQLGHHLMALLDGTDLDSKVGETVMLLTVSEAGWPHVALLSVGEVLAVRPDHVRVALWKGTRTGDNLRRTSRATLALVYRGAGYYVELQVLDTGNLDTGHTTLDRFSCRVTRVLTDVVGYATLTSGIRFDLERRNEVVSHWERTVEAMRAV